jgi:broad specificity phosphatase PhoE
MTHVCCQQLVLIGHSMVIRTLIHLLFHLLDNEPDNSHHGQTPVI